MKNFMLCATSILLFCNSSSVFAQEFVRTRIDEGGTESLSMILSQTPTPTPTPTPIQGCWSTIDKKMIKVGKKDSSGRICQSNGTFR